MKEDSKMLNKPGRRQKVKTFKPRKKKSAEEDAAIQYLQAQYDKIVPDEIKTFKDLPLSQKTLTGLKENNFITPTEIQRQAISYALQGKDVLGAARTGSGKTLAFLVPLLERLFCVKWTRYDGLGALVISPTRELAYQTYETLRKVGRHHDFSAGLVIGGQNLRFERKRMDQVNIVICTPGRLLQHMDENPLFAAHELRLLVLDEADRCLDLGFSAALNAILDNLPAPPQRQTLLFSATQTTTVKDLARLSLSFPLYVAPHEQAPSVTPECLQQSYIVCDVDDKMGILWSFIKHHLKHKILVFMATCKQVKYTYELFCKLRPGVSLLALYGTLHQEKREAIYREFCRKSNVVLFATDLASRGLDFPRVGWVLQHDCPEDVRAYIHRVGRTARGLRAAGEALLMLLPHEEAIVTLLNDNKIPINKISVDPSKVVGPQRKIEALLSDNTELKQSAQRAFMSYVRSVHLMSNKDIFDVRRLDTDAYARSLGLLVPPHIKFLHNKHNAPKREVAADTDVVNKLTPSAAAAAAAAAAAGDSSDHSAADDLTVGKQHTNKHKLKKQIPKLTFHNNEDDSDDDDFLKVKTKPHADVDTTPLEHETHISKKKAKPVTKAALAKKILKRKIKVNTSVKFTEEGAPIDDDRRHLKSAAAQELLRDDVGGIDIPRAARLLHEEDHFDKIRFRQKVKAKHKEQKRKLKNRNKEEEGDKDEFVSASEGEGEGEGPDVSWLPDPERLYGAHRERLADTSDSEQGRGRGRGSHQSHSDSDSDDGTYHRRPKRPLVTSRGPEPGSSGGGGGGGPGRARARRAARLSAAPLTVTEAEALAISLLQHAKT